MRTLGRHALVLIVAAVAMLLLGLPNWIAPIMTGELVQCADDCGSSDGEGHCPPGCTQGSCAKVCPALPNVAPMLPLVARVSSERIGPPLQRLAADPPPRCIEHPPRRS